MKRRRGFTLIEMMVVVSITGTIAAGIAAFYLEARVSAARIEAQVRLQREASLVIELVSRDLRSGRARELANPTLVSIDGAEGAIRYEREARAFVRTEAGRRQVVSRSLRTLEVAEAAGGYRIRLHLERPSIGARAVVLEREAFARKVLP